MATMYPAIVNSPATELFYSIDSSTDVILVADGDKLPDAPNIVTIGTGEDAETIFYANKAGNALTDVIRGFQGTAKEWLGGTPVARYFTAYDYDAVRENVEQLLHGKIINVKDYGAVGDGVTDDSLAIKDALAAAINNNSTLVIPKGHTFIACGLIVDGVSGLKIDGGGCLKLKAATNQRILTITDSTNIHINNIEFDGDMYNQEGEFPHHDYNLIFVFESNAIKIDNCYLHDSLGGGVVLESSSKCIISRSHFYNTYDNNILVCNAGADNNIVCNNICDTTHAQNNIFTTAKGDSSPPGTDWIYNNIIEGNVCLNSYDTGIEVGLHNNGAVVANNIVEDALLVGILVRDSSNVQVVGNHIKNTHYTGLSLMMHHDDSDTGNIAVANNSVVGSGDKGIVSSCGFDNTIANNLIDMRQDGGEGMVISKSRAIISGNIIVNLKQDSSDSNKLVAAIFVQTAASENILNLWIKDNVLHSNIIAWAGGDPTIDTAAYNVIIENNHIVRPVGAVYNQAVQWQNMTDAIIYLINNKYIAGRWNELIDYDSENENIALTSNGNIKLEADSWEI